MPTVQWLSDFYVGALLNLKKINRVADHKFSVIFINIFLSTRVGQPPFRSTRSVFHRGHGVPFVAPVVLSVLETRWTREHAKRVSSRRKFSFIP